ncbi:MAG: hypothetical protein ACPLPW_08740, partial [bacterium]
FGHVLDLFELMPYIGGRSASGDGKIMFRYENRPQANLYREFLQEKKEEIKALLTDLESRL